MVGPVEAPGQLNLVYLMYWIIFRYTWCMKDLITLLESPLYVLSNGIYLTPADHVVL